MVMVALMSPGEFSTPSWLINCDPSYCFFGFLICETEQEVWAYLGNALKYRHQTRRVCLARLPDVKEDALGSFETPAKTGSGAISRYDALKLTE